jgi:serine/threonine protein phosphatase PrpC
MQVAARTEVGHVRARNEDALLVAPDDRLIAVCDGLGGHPSGDVASATAVESLRASAPSAAASAEALVDALRAAHVAVVAAAGEEPDRRGMATTVVAATLGDADGTATVAHVGDSRAYLRDPDGTLTQVTRDHGMGGYITQALGLDRDVEPDVVEVATPPGARLLLCSDGLSNMVDADAIGALLGRGDAQEACDALVDEALGRGGLDNVTVVVAAF